MSFEEELRKEVKDVVENMTDKFMNGRITRMDYAVKLADKMTSLFIDYVDQAIQKHIENDH